jgi:peptidoglycan/LPS O-acetylase OafA/YrhL
LNRLAAPAVSWSKAECDVSPPVKFLTPEPAKRFYRPELDVLRFAAFLSVFLYHGLPGFVLGRHTGWLAGAAVFEDRFKETGKFGVCLFFLLSAYLITELLCREKSLTGTIDVRSFYVRRTLRIWPLYFSFLLAGVALGLVFRDYRLESGRLAAFLLLSGNWYVATAGCSANPIAPLWSISLEEQFYLLWPWVGRLRGRASIFATCAVLLPVSFISLHHLGEIGADVGRTVWVNSFVQFQFFALGALLALVLRGRALPIPAFLRFVMVVAGGASWFAATLVLQRADRLQSPGSLMLGYAAVASGCVLLLLGVLGMTPSKLPKPLIFLGKISYGLYVFHMLTLDLWWYILWPSASQRTLGTNLQLAARAALILLAALGTDILLAMLSYRFLETPFLRMKDRFTYVRSRQV